MVIMFHNNVHKHSFENSFHYETFYVYMFVIVNKILKDKTVKHLKLGTSVDIAPVHVQGQICLI